MLGTPRLREKFQVTKSTGLPVRGIGRGIYELVRLASQERVGQAPTKAQVDGWVRGLYMIGAVLSSPVGRMRALPAYSQLSFQELYRNDGFDFAAEVDAALEQTRGVLRQLLRLHGAGHLHAAYARAFPGGVPRGHHRRLRRVMHGCVARSALARSSSRA